MALLKTNTGIGTTNPTSALHVIGDGLVTGVVTATTFNGNINSNTSSLGNASATRLSVLGVSTFIGGITGTISTATKLETPRTFEITGDVVASPIAFDGTGNVSLAATIQPNSVGLGTDTFGDYVRNISGTANEITVTGGTGEGSTPVISFAPNPLIGGNVTIGNDLQVNNNLNVNGSITVGGTSGYILVNEFRVTDADIVLGFTTDISGNDVSNDTTANHGGIAIASTEGNPIITLTNPGVGETLPATYKKFMWFKAGSFAGLNTDAWLSNYAIGIGSTQFPSGTRLAAGSVQITENDLAVVRNINASGIVTAPTFVGNLTGTASTASFATTAFTLNGVAEESLRVAFAQTAGISTNVIGGVASVTQLSVSGVTTLSSVGASQLNVSGVTTSVGGFVGNLTGTATTATNLSNAANITTGTINAARLTGTYNIDISGNAATADYADVAGIATNVSGGTASVTQLSVSGVSTLGVVTAGNIFSTGIVTAPTFVGNLTGTASTASFATTAFSLNGTVEGNLNVAFARVAGIATFATNAGIATNLRGGVAGNVPYQSAPDTTTFVPNGSSGQVLLFNGSIPIWSNVSAASGAFGGIAVYDEGNLVGTAGSIVALNFVSPNLVVTGTSGANGIATVRMSDNLVGTALSISGISTFSNNVLIGSGITMYASTGIISATAFYGSGLNLSDLILGKIEGLQIQNEGSNVGTGFSFATLNFIGDYVTATGVGTVANITFTTPPYALVAGVSTSVIGGIASVTSLNVSGVSTIANLRITPVGSGATVGGIGVTYFGDGSNLTGVSGGVSISTNTTDQNQLITYAISTGSTTGFGATASGLVFNPSTTRLGIGTTNPLQNLHIQGNLLVAAGSATTQHITQRAYELEGGSLSWEGTAGQLFSITNNLTSGPIFSVNDVSGIPSIEVTADGTIELAPFADGNVGIATTRPTSRLHVIGDALVVGVVTATTFSGNATSATSVIGGIASVTQLSVSGITTLGVTSATNLTAQQLNVSGLSTFAGVTTSTSTLFANQLSVAGVSTFAGITTVTGPTLFSRQLSVAGVVTATTFSGNATSATFATTSGIATFATTAGVSTSVIGGIASVTQLSVSGVSTFSGVTTSTSTLFANQLSVAGVSTFAGITTNTSTLFANQLSVSGVSTFAGITTNTSTLFANQLSVSGVSTFAGITTNTSTLFANQLSVSGVSTFAGITTVTGTTLFARQLNVSGVSTFAGITTVTSTLFANQLSVAGVSTFAGITTNTSTLFANQLSVSGVSTFAGITTNTSTLFANQLSVSGVSTFAGITTVTSTLFANQLSVAGVSTFAGITTVTGPTLFSRQLSVSGVSTFAGITTVTSTLFANQLSVAGVASITSDLVVNGGTLDVDAVNNRVGVLTTFPLQPFQVNPTGSSVVVVDNLGELGIGTTNPTSKLHVIGSALITGVSTIANLRVTPVGTGATVGGIGVTYYGDGSQLSGVVSPASNGEFYTGVSSSLQLTPLSYETSIYTFPSTAGKQYVIESINVANVDTSVGVGTTVNIIASIQDSSGEQTYIAYNVPIVNGGLIELLKNPMVAGPSDVIKMWVTNGNYIGVNNAAEVYMNVTEYTSTAYIREYASTVSIATTDITTVYTSSTYPSVIESIHLANRTDVGDYPVSVVITNGLTTTYLAKDLLIPRYATVDILDRPKRIETGATIGIKVGQTSTIDVIIAGKQITS